MTLQLPSLLDVSSDKYISIWNYGLGKKNPLNPVGNKRKNYVCLIDEKTS